MRLHSILLVAIVAASCASASSTAKLRLIDEQETLLRQPGSFCQGCRSIVSFMSRFNSSTKRTENRELLSRFCEIYYPASTDFKDGPYPIFVESLLDMLTIIDPVNYCDKIGACGSLPSRDNSFQDRVILANDGGLVCNFCTDIVKQFKQRLDDPSFIDDIHHKVEAFCEYLTVIDADKQCRAALESYIDQALDFIKQMKPRDLCRSLQMCPTVSARPTNSERRRKEQKKVLPTLVDFNDFGIETSVQLGGQQVKSLDDTLVSNSGINSPNCLFCKTFVKEIFKFIKDNRTEDNIRDALDHGCELIYHDKDKRVHCEDLVRAYTRELLELLADETNPEVICVLLGQCTFQTMLPTKSTASLKPTNNKRVSIGELISMLDPTIEVNSMRTCVECKLFLKYLQQTIQEPASQEEMKDWLLKNLCANLGDQGLVDTCTKFINQESAVFFQAIVQSLDPEKSCQQLGACSAQIRNEYLIRLQRQIGTLRDSTSYNELVKLPPAIVSVEPTTAGPLCQQCVQIVTKIDDYLSTHPIDHDISVLKDKVCNTIQDDNLRGECVMIIQTFGQEIIQAISNMDNPRQLCHKIALCSSAMN